MDLLVDRLEGDFIIWLGEHGIVELCHPLGEGLLLGCHSCYYSGQHRVRDQTISAAHLFDCLKLD